MLALWSSGFTFYAWSRVSGLGIGAGFGVWWLQSLGCYLSKAKGLFFLFDLLSFPSRTIPIHDPKLIDCPQYRKRRRDYAPVSCFWERRHVCVCAHTHIYMIHTRILSLTHIHTHIQIHTHAHAHMHTNTLCVLNTSIEYSIHTQT